MMQNLFSEEEQTNQNLVQNEQFLNVDTHTSFQLKSWQHNYQSDQLFSQIELGKKARPEPHIQNALRINVQEELHQPIYLVQKIKLAHLNNHTSFLLSFRALSQFDDYISIRLCAKSSNEDPIPHISERHLIKLDKQWKKYIQPISFMGISTEEPDKKQVELILEIPTLHYPVDIQITEVRLIEYKS